MVMFALLSLKKFLNVYFYLNVKKYSKNCRSSIYLFFVFFQCSKELINNVSHIISLIKVNFTFI